MSRKPSSFAFKASVLLIGAALSQNLWAADTVCEDAGGCHYSGGMTGWTKNSEKLTDQAEPLNIRLKAGSYSSQSGIGILGVHASPAYNSPAHLTVPEGTTLNLNYRSIAGDLIGLL